MENEKFDFGQLLEDYCSVAIKKTDFDRLKKELERLSHENKQLKSERDAAQNLCEIYFVIAANAIGEDEVRAQREQALKSGE